LIDAGVASRGKHSIARQTGLTVTPSAAQLGVVTLYTLYFTEEIVIDSGGPKYATVTFYYGVYAYTIGTKIGEQTISEVVPRILT
jgi:hypothetical protein